jgi:protein TonB
MPAVMVARLLKPAAYTPAAVPSEAVEEETGAAGEERPAAADPDPDPDRIEDDPPPAGPEDAFAWLSGSPGGAALAARGTLRLDAAAVIRAEPTSAAAIHRARRTAVGTASLAAVTPPAGGKRNIEAALREIRRRVESKKTYPLAARRWGWEGEVLVEIVLGSAGELEGLRLLRQSGFPLLDRATLTAVRAAVPFPPVPGRVKIPVSYRLAAD